ncbi:hypothetical protein [Heyndrickxia acidicola]|uniref:Uncharacterized protein n=1 Tax=Heyndrickxia acidicola TaxID=209389 RepID=A0ABU6MMN6_9BACI|nr:hypothetical protein [Heyndrickxia acidicola]
MLTYRREKTGSLLAAGKEGLIFILPSGAGSRKAEIARLPATSIRRAILEVCFLTSGMAWLMTSSRWRLELDQEKRRSPAYRRPA